MTPQEFYSQTVTYENEFDIRTMNLMSNYKGIICDLMKDYAKTMCQKQKEICAEEAETKDDSSKLSYDAYYVIDKDSILNSPLPEELQDGKD